jgi:hypothetical protein
MEQAFQVALNELAKRRETPHLDRRSLQLVVNATVPSGTEFKPVTGAPFGKLLYSARKLGRGWCNYTNPWGESPSRLARLQDDWTVLATALVRLPLDQRVTLLRAFVESLDLGHIPSSSRKYSYLERQRAHCPAKFHGLTAIPTVTPTSQTTFIVHALEELADCSLEERQGLHAELARVAPANGSTRPDWLLAELGAWIAVQHPRPNHLAPFGPEE